MGIIFILANGSNPPSPANIELTSNASIFNLTLRLLLVF